MKEATGELSGTVIIVVLIAALAAFFFNVIWPFYDDTFTKDESCANAVCDVGYNSNGLAWCHPPGKTSASDRFECPYRG